MVLDLPGLSSIGQISIPVQDIDRGVKFYQESLGMDHLFQLPGTALFDCSGIRIMLGVLEEDAAVQSGSLIYFMVDAIHDSTRAFQEKGLFFLESRTWWPNCLTTTPGCLSSRTRTAMC